MPTAPYFLTVIDGECVPTQLAIDGSLQLGRDPSCDVRLLDDRASRFHARIEFTDAILTLVDLGSSNGCYVGDQRITAATPLNAGAIFSCGGVSFAVISSHDHNGKSQAVTDHGHSLAIAGQQPTRSWRAGDEPKDLALIHELVNAWHQSSSNEAPHALANALQRLLNCTHSAVVLSGRVIGGGIDNRLALRLAHGDQARLLCLGRELVGHTIAKAAIGSAVTAPLGDNGHIVITRGIDDELLNDYELRIIAAIAAELSPVLAKRATHVDGLIGDSEPMTNLRRRIARVSTTDATVLITGESGTGKELVARALHNNSGRVGGPFIAVNCAAVAAELFEAELFGHEVGAFTGATTARPGRFRQAHGGTLFLDEIGDLPERLQPKLLRALQEGTVEPVGSSTSIPVDARIVTATNRDLQADVDSGRFRADLFYRLDVVRLATPALRDHRADIPALANHLLAHAAQETGVMPLTITPEALTALERENWPGNVRQLGNVLTRALIAATDRITIDDLDLHPARQRTDDKNNPATFPTLSQIEATHVAAALSRTNGNRSQAARLLGISRPTLLKKIGDYGLDSE